jgi:hypothetical protein
VNEVMIICKWHWRCWEAEILVCSATLEDKKWLTRIAQATHNQKFRKSEVVLDARTPGQFNDPILNPIYVYDLSIYCWDLRPESNKARSLAHLKLKPISLLYSFFHFSQIGPLRSLNKKKEKRRTQPMLSWIISL